MYFNLFNEFNLSFVWIFNTSLIWLVELLQAGVCVLLTWFYLSFNTSLISGTTSLFSKEHRE